MHQLITLKENLEANAKFLRGQLACNSNETMAQTTDIKDSSSNEERKMRRMRHRLDRWPLVRNGK
jgi:hypothetical protein